MNTERFEFSQHPNYLEWYQCYDDLSCDEWVDGSELRENQNNWTPEAIAKWNFFYRPFPPAVGRPQKKMIRERQATIHACEEYTRQAEERIRQELELIRSFRRRFIGWVSILGLAALVFFSQEWRGLALLAVLSTAIPGIQFANVTSAARKRIAALEQSIVGYREAILKSQREIGLLEKEIAHLLGLIPHRLETSTIQRWLDEEIRQMELECLSEFVGAQVSAENVGNYLRHNVGDERVNGLLIDTWGALQPSHQKGPFGAEATGLGKAREALNARADTWQVGPEGQPVFRLLFLQYVFPLEKNLNISSFFYDFVTRKTYGTRYETFQYNHVTNYSIREVQAEEETWVEETGLTTISNWFRGKALRALTLAVASGNHFRCVLVDEDVVSVLNEIMAQEKKYQSLAESLLSDEELRAKFRDDTALTAKWKTTEKARIEAEMKRVVRDKQTLSQKARRTRAILDSIRNCIEQYVVRVQQPA